MRSAGTSGALLTARTRSRNPDNLPAPMPALKMLSTICTTLHPFNNSLIRRALAPAPRTVFPYRCHTGKCTAQARPALYSSGAHATPQHKQLSRANARAEKCATQIYTTLHPFNNSLIRRAHAPAARPIFPRRCRARPAARPRWERGRSPPARPRCAPPAHRPGRAAPRALRRWRN